MAKETIGIGSAANDGTGDPIRTAFSKVNSNFTELYDRRLDQAPAPTNPVALNAQRITGLADPSSAQDAATKAYVDALAQGLDPKGSVKCATTGNITLSGEQTIDGVTTSVSRVLVKNQSTASQNGIYVSAAGSWTRATDADAWTELPGAFCFVEEGTANGDTGWVCTVNAGGTLGSTSVTWVQFTSVGSAGTKHSFSATLGGTDQTGIAASTWTKIAFGTEEFDTGNQFSTVTQKYVPAAGKAHISAAVYVETGVVDQSLIFVAIYKNDVAHKLLGGVTPSGTNGVLVNGSAIVDANGTDGFDIYVYATGAGTKSVSGSGVNSYFQGWQI